ncbi:molybdopterin converting factor subunit 1 [Acetobacter fallax]|uniref:Molybdopterin synthase sulfur carrier subunit n=1 Tax=Acetobacter fallax TaxID=1737473 RepID=A0ABX0KBN5_9PROT|nr:molybdopterin converting factor subunit 1 [Acetobacter fallax]NHO32456.1 molybdopterin converting factor subunit 1 [Acetobacter fallax]NHO36016.1 molybdopterin converting factor subunit 1 [Acetobacter fallax]
MSGTVTVLYFAALRERVGRSREVVSLDGVMTVGAMLMSRRDNDAVLDAVFSGPGTVRVAVNKILADFEAPLHDGDEVAFFPPMTGG